MMRFFALIFMTLGWNMAVRAQVVNIENRRMHTDSVRTAGSLSLGLSFTENNGKQLFVTRNALALQSKSKSLRDIWLVLANLDLSKADGAAFSNSAFLHLRYNRKMNRLLRWEAFTQAQYNRVLGIGSRWLAGTGPRLKLFSTEKSALYWGNLYMFEYETTTAASPVISRQHRLSAYLSATFDLNPALPCELISTTYFQPRLDRLADYRLSHETSLELNITKKLRATTRLYYFFDAAPPAGIAGRALALEQGFRVGF
jgi:hypothetical protein